ncbi:hypothetical protein B484DRAFT_401306, partial [Ochromonadaceae sp. CCMP2298]
MSKSNAKRSAVPSSQEPTQEPTQEPPSDAELLEGLSVYPPSQPTEGVDSLLVLSGSPVSWEGDLTQSQTQQSQASELPAIAAAPVATRVSVRNCKGVPPTRYAPPATPPDVPATTVTTVTTVATYEGLAERSTDGLWTFYALACAFTNTILDADSSPAELADACEAIIDIVTSDITGVDDYGVKIIPAHLRFPVPNDNDTSPPILNYAASDFTLPAIAALHPQDVEHYCLKNGIDDKSFAYEGLGRDVLTNRDNKIDPAAWLKCTRVIYKRFHTLFREGITATALEVIIHMAHNGEDSDVISPGDAMWFFRTADPARFSEIQEGESALLLESLLNFSSLHALACPSFLANYFPGIWLQVFEFWLRPGPELPPVTNNVKDVQRVLRKVANMQLDNMSLHFILTQISDPLGLYHYYGANAKFEKMYPLFMKETRITQIRMTLSFWHTSHPIISDEFLVLMTHFGGCAPFPQPLEYVDPVLVIAQGNHCKLLQEEDTPYFLLVPPPDAFSTEDYTAWMGTVDHLGFTFEQLGHTIDYFSRQADFGPATGNIVALPGFRNVRYRMSTAPYGRRHPCLKYVETLRAFYALPTSQHIIEFYDPPLPASVQALSAPERKEFQRQQEIDRRAFQEGGHWLNHRARMQYGPPETDEDIQADLHERTKAHPRIKALTKSTSLPKSPLKLVSKASGAAKKAVSPAVEELDTSTAAPALPSVQVYDEWGRPRPNTAHPTTQSAQSVLGFGGTSHSAHTHEQENFTRQYLLSVSAPNLLSTAAPENAVAQCATLNLQVWEWGNSARQGASVSSSSSSSSSSSESSRRKRKRRHHAKHGKHGGKRSGKRHKHSKHSSHKPKHNPTSSSSESGSESDKHGTTTFKDAADRQVVRVKGTEVQTIRVSEPLRAFAPPEHIDAVLADVSSGRSDRDPSWYTLPAFHDLVWFSQRETNSGIALKVFYFSFDLARCFTPDSLRLFHFLPTVRAGQVANAHFKCTREDWVLILRGMAVTYGPAYDAVWQTAFQSMHSTACNEQVGHSFSYEYLEAYLNDMFFRFAQAARNPRIV